MKTTAKTIQFAKIAGLILVGKNEDGSPQWLGSRQQFANFSTWLNLSKLGAFPIYPWKLFSI